jgi:uncharacterized protein (TIGR02145 family)
LGNVKLKTLLNIHKVAKFQKRDEMMKMRFCLFISCLLLISCGLDVGGSPAASDQKKPVIVIKEILAPKIYPKSGSFSSSQIISILADSGQKIYYTTDGTLPTDSSAIYQGPFNINDNAIIVAIADSAGKKSRASSERYFVFLWQQGINYDSITDIRDHIVYRTVKIFDQIWFAENLAYRGPDGTLGWWCENDTSFRNLGRLYDWNTAMAGSYSEKAQGICPVGWHIPSSGEWYHLFSNLGGKDSAGYKLKSTSGWAYGYNGIDQYGFRAMPAGMRYYPTGEFMGTIGATNFWSSTRLSMTESVNFGLWSDPGSTAFSHNQKPMTYGYSVRCIMDSASANLNK